MKAFFVRMSGIILKSPSFPLAEQHNHNKTNGIICLQKPVEIKKNIQCLELFTAQKKTCVTRVIEKMLAFFLFAFLWINQVHEFYTVLLYAWASEGFFPGGALGDFCKIFPGGGPKVVKFVFSHSK